MTAPGELSRLRLAVRRSGPQVLVVCEPEAPLLDGLPDGDWADAGGPVELLIATELLARVADSAPPEALGVAVAECIGRLAEAVAESAAWPFGEGAEA